MKDLIPLSVPNICGNELKYITQAIEDDWVSTAGPYVDDFERKFAEYLGMPQAVACQSGTAGLHLAAIVCGVTPADMVIVPSLTFIAAVNPVKYIGAEPVFMDCDDSLCIDPVKLEAFCEEECEFLNGILFHKATGKRISAMIVVHVFGNMADMEAIMEIAEKYNIKVIEDSTEALGTKYTSGKYNGSFAGTIGNIGVYSFNGNKIMTTGGGGMIVSKDLDLLKHARHLTTQAKQDTQNFYHDEIGFNYRLTSVQSAMGLGQLEQLDRFIETKKNNYELYFNEISKLDDYKMLPFREGIRSNHWFYSVLCKDMNTRVRMIEFLRENNIASRPIWGLICDQKPYEGSICYRIEKARYYWERIVNVPCSTNLTKEQVLDVVEVIKSFK